MLPGKYFQCSAPVISAKRPKGAEKWCDGWLVKVPHSIRYNGGIILDKDGNPDPNGEWYDGYEVPSPVIPAGYELKSIHTLSELNARPPYHSMLLRKVATT